MNMNENQGLMLKVKHCFDVLDFLFTLKWENLCAKQFSGCLRKSESFKMCLYFGLNDGASIMLTQRLRQSTSTMVILKTMN